jgi:exosortase A
MATVAARPADAGNLSSDWQRQLTALGVTVAALLLLFWRDAADMAAIWWNSSTYNHCLFIPPIIGWLVWQRRAELSRIVPRAWLLGLALVAAGALGWLLGYAGGISLARHAGLVMMLQGAVVVLLGKAASRGLAFPIFFAIFAIPFGDEFVPPMQTLTAELTMGLLNLSGVPALLEGVFITTPVGYFEVAEACAGVKFLVAMVALGALIANVCFRSWRPTRALHVRLYRHPGARQRHPRLGHDLRRGRHQRRICERHGSRHLWLLLLRHRHGPIIASPGASLPPHRDRWFDPPCSAEVSRTERRLWPPRLGRWRCAPALVDRDRRRGRQEPPAACCPTCPGWTRRSTRPQALAAALRRRRPCSVGHYGTKRPRGHLASRCSPARSRGASWSASARCGGAGQRLGVERRRPAAARWASRTSGKPRRVPRGCQLLPRRRYPHRQRGAGEAGDDEGAVDRRLTTRGGGAGLGHP